MTTYPRPSDSVAALSRAGGASEGHDTDHGRIIGLHENVKHYGAVGDGVADDIVAIQAAVDFAKANGATVFFPKGRYKISSPILIGNGTGGTSMTLRGELAFSASDGWITRSRIEPTDINQNAFTINTATSQSQSLQFEGLQVNYASRGTGVGFDFTAGSQVIGTTLHKVSVANAGTGFKIGGSVNFKATDCTALTCTKGWWLTTSGSENANLPQFDNCYAQVCVTAGWYVDGYVSDARFESCVIQANTGPGILLDAGGALIHPTFTSCWWEFPGDDMIQIKDGSWLSQATFVSCQFDASGGSDYVIQAVGAAASSTVGSNLTFINCYVPNLASGYLLYTATDPTNTTDPGWFGVTCIATPGRVKGLHTYHSAANRWHNVFIGADYDDPVDSNSVYGIKASYTRLNGDSNVVIKNNLGAIEFTEVTAPAAGATNHARLYAEDNGAGKTRLVVRFPTGAVQVLATEP